MGITLFICDSVLINKRCVNSILFCAHFIKENIGGTVFITHCLTAKPRGELKLIKEVRFENTSQNTTDGSPGRSGQSILVRQSLHAVRMYCYT